MVGQSEQIRQVEFWVYVGEFYIEESIDVGKGRELDEVGNVGQTEIWKPLFLLLFQEEMEV